MCSIAETKPVRIVGMNTNSLQNTRRLKDTVTFMCAREIDILVVLDSRVSHEDLSFKLTKMPQVTARRNGTYRDRTPPTCETCWQGPGL